MTEDPPDPELIQKCKLFQRESAFYERLEEMTWVIWSLNALEDNLGLTDRPMSLMATDALELARLERWDLQDEWERFRASNGIDDETFMGFGMVECAPLMRRGFL